MIQISPPLVAGQAEFDEIVGILGDVLAEAGKRTSERRSGPAVPSVGHGAVSRTPADAGPQGRVDAIEGGRWRTEIGARTGTNGAVVVADDVTRRYGEGDTAVDALRGVSLDVARGQADGGHGAVGLRQVDADAHPRRARQADVGHGRRSPAPRSRRSSDTDLTKLRREHIGFVFQFFNLLPMLTAEENITLPLSIAGEKPDRSGFDEPASSKVGLADRLHAPARPSSPAASSSASRSRARSSRGRRCSSPTSRPATSTRRPAREILELLRDSVDDATARRP